MDLSITIALDGRDQSVGLEKMQKNEENYNKVLESLLKFYRQLGNQVPCTEIKTLHCKIDRSRHCRQIQDHAQLFTICKEKQQIKQYDQNLKTQYRDIYRQQYQQGSLTAEKNTVSYILSGKI